MLNSSFDHIKGLNPSDVRVLLVHPHPSCREFSTPLLPTGLAYVGAVLEKNGITVRAVDLGILEAPWEWKTLEEKILSFEPHIIGITSMTSTHNNALAVARFAKKLYSKSIVAMGGPHPTFTFHEVLTENPEVDLVVRREGEVTFLDFIQAMIEGRSLLTVGGIAFKHQGNVVATPERPLIEDLDSLPYPARHLFPLKEYLQFWPLICVISSRGCPFQCIYCSASTMWGHKCRLRSAENFVNEIEFLLKTYNVKHIGFSDDTFTLDKSRTTEVCKEILERGLSLKWACETRADTITKDLLGMMYDSGCYDILYGIESGNQQILNAIKRGINLHQIERAVKWTKEVGIHITGSIILGLPGETTETIRQTIDFVKRLDIESVIINSLTPYPGTEVYENAEKYGITIQTRNWAEYNSTMPMIESRELSIENRVLLCMEAMEELEQVGAIKHK